MSRFLPGEFLVVVVEDGITMWSDVMWLASAQSTARLFNGTTCLVLRREVHPQEKEVNYLVLAQDRVGWVLGSGWLRPLGA